MKKLLTILVFSVLFAACTKTDPFEKIFDISEDAAIAPIEQNSQLITELNADTKILSRILSANGVQSYPYDVDNEKAIIINAPSDLLSGLPEIDFDKYSIVVGQYFLPSSAYSLRDQRILLSNNKITLYLDVKDEGYGAAYLDMGFFASVYPKMPDMPIEVISSTRVNAENK